MKSRIYLAAPLFSEAEKTFNLSLAKRLEAASEAVEYVWLPQKYGYLFSELIEKKHYSVERAAGMILDSDTKYINECSHVVAVLDGRTVDEGVAWELGYAFANDIPCVSLQTDSRRLLPAGNNPMIEACLSARFFDIGSLIMWFRHVANQ